MTAAMDKPYQSSSLLVLLTLTVLSFSREAVAVSCVELQRAYVSYNCQCRPSLDNAGNPTIDVVFDCSNLGLTAVPKKAPGTTVSVSLVIAELILANNSITRLDSDSFTGMRARALDLSGNPIVSVADRAFEPLANDIRELKLDGEKTQGPPKTAFAFLADLEVLTLDNYSVPVLGDSAHFYFLAFPNLKHLTLSDWSIAAMEPDAFRGPLDLQSLTIEREAGLAGLPLPVLKDDSLENLRKLKISATTMQEISQDAFDKLTKLEELDLSDNHISKIKPLSLRGLGPSLKKLSFASNFLRSDSTSDFSGLSNLPNLDELDLSGNEDITAIPNLSQLNPDEQTSLKIFLGNNKINSVSSSAFSNIAQRVHTLDLSGNRIATMDSNAFAGMSHLQVLRLSQQTGLTRSLALPSSLSQSAAGSLTHLYLDGVQLDISNLWAVLSEMAKLQVLDLTSTGLSTLPSLALEKMTDLQEFYLSGNSLTSLDQVDLTGPRQTLKKLDLSNNPLSRISNCALAHYTSFPITLALYPAPLVCDCQLRWLLRAAKEGTIRFVEGQAPRCANLNNELLEQKSESDVCPDSSYTDPQCDNPYTTPAPTTTPRAPSLSLKVIKTTSSSITLEWTLSQKRDLTSYTVRLTNSYADSAFTRDNIDPAEFRLEIKPLRADTQHKVCVIANFLTINSVTTCTFVRTDSGNGSGTSGQTGESDSDDIGIIIGAVVGAILLLIVICAILYLLILRRRPKKESSAPVAPIQPRNFTKSELPAMTDDSRTFTRPKRPVDHHDGMQVVAISDGQVSDRHASNGSARVGRAAMLNSNGSYKVMSSGASSPGGASAGGSTSGSQSIYENDHSELPSPPPSYNDRLRWGPRQPGYYNEAFESDKYDEIEPQREVTL